MSELYEDLFGKAMTDDLLANAVIVENNYWNWYFNTLLFGSPERIAWLMMKG